MKKRLLAMLVALSLVGPSTFKLYACIDPGDGNKCVPTGSGAACAPGDPCDCTNNPLDEDLDCIKQVGSCCPQ